MCTNIDVDAVQPRIPCHDRASERQGSLLAAKLRAHQRGAAEFVELVVHELVQDYVAYVGCRRIHAAEGDACVLAPLCPSVRRLLTQILKN